MPDGFEGIYTCARDWAANRGIEVQQRELPPGKAGEFNGLTFIINSLYDSQERTFYLIHALGSVVRWSKDKAAVQTIFDESHVAKKTKDIDVARLNRAIDCYREFEKESSEYVVWLLAKLGFSAAIRTYTNFMRADLEALTEFHRTGRAPVWREFFAKWNKDVAEGRKEILPFGSKPIPHFTPVRIEKQEILQQQDRRTGH